MASTAQEYLGRFRLLNLIRAGKACQVWEAISPESSERRAIKLLTGDYRRLKSETVLLRHEAAVGRNMDHPGVIKTYEFAIHRSTAYLVMEYFAAPNLKQVLQQGVEPLAARLSGLIEHAAEGLAYFHAQGWVHRDVKPDNFLLAATGETKLIDFALAQRARKGLSRLLPVRSAVQGTRSYMSPEQIRAKPLDERADVYSFGCLLFELATGRPPFTGTSANELLTKHLRSAPPSLAAANPKLSEPYVQLVKRMLAKEPKDRPGSMGEFLREFRALKVFK